ncbi:serine/threonine-protein kinase [Nostoc sp. TCL26-01]|uniref:serine/threonine protein kinase n=1 Tax=Nostoc sp. TCL26-01 TaxID=2576904 RepID=UPI0015B8910D|nr:serine/threonine-protein kinase [Nostoc sp. TCL26-01]QLE55146.1 serine/threonine protein kinase [Nostoc sp. TCL26-01]
MELDVNNQGKTPLIQHPDISALGYQVIRELAKNSEGRRITYLACDCKTGEQVVIKEFCCASVDVEWSGFKAYQREANILQQLNHPRIPRYINSLETATGCYLVQEYKNALSLGTKRNWSPEEVKQIAISILEILVYLQQQIDPIIHRDIKPENILVDEQLNAYLVDFGLARVKGAKMPLTSLVAGTPGFMPPEAESGYTLSFASDLYSLGATLLCLLTDTRSVDIHKLIDHGDRFHCQKLLPHLNLRFRSWLMGMVEPKWQYRFAHAADALAILQPIQVTGTPTMIELLTTTVKLRRQTMFIGLAMICILAIAGTNLMLSQQSAAQQLQETDR